MASEAAMKHTAQEKAHYVVAQIGNIGNRPDIRAVQEHQEALIVAMAMDFFKEGVRSGEESAALALVTAMRKDRTCHL